MGAVLQSQGLVEAELVPAGFGYDPELLDRDEVDEIQLIRLRGIVKISHIVINGTSLLRFDVAPADRWAELSPANLDRWLAGERHPSRDALRTGF